MAEECVEIYFGGLSSITLYIMIILMKRLRLSPKKVILFFVRVFEKGI